MIKHIVSVSGGKDSTALLLLAIERFGRQRITPIFCDTGNELQEVYDYLGYLERVLDVQIVRLKASFGNEIAAKRKFIARDQRTRREYDTRPVFDAAASPVWRRDGRGRLITRLKKRDGASFSEFVQKTVKVGGGRRVRWSNKAKRRALAVLHPTGNLFLDLCLWKGRFPSSKAQFCTEELKTNMAVEFQLKILDEGHTVVSWQGIRRDESQNRRNALRFERVSPGMYHYRPLVDWTAAQVFDYHASNFIEPNPLYKQGCSRVGCICINAEKAELAQIAARWPAHIDRIDGWENLVSQASKRGFSTFMYKELEKKGSNYQRIYAANSIVSVIQWAKTSRGGRQQDMFAGLIDADECSSSYGLCEGISA